MFPRFAVTRSSLGAACSTRRFEKAIGSVTEGTWKQTVTGPTKLAVVEISNARLPPDKLNPPGRVPAEAGSMGVIVVVPGTVTPEKLIVTIVAPTVS